MRNERLNPVFIIFIAAICICALAACGNKEDVKLSPIVIGEDGENVENSANTDRESKASSVKKNGKSDSGGEGSSGGVGAESGSRSFVCEDKDGLVTLRVSGGAAEIRLNPERWESLYGVDDLKMDFSNPDKFIPVYTDNGKIREACIGTVSQFSEWSGMWNDFPSPVIMMIMEDGTIEWAGVDPYAFETYHPFFYSHGALPWLEDIVSLKFSENNGKGIGEPTIYATDADGLRYDLSELFTHALTDMRNLGWYCTLESQDQNLERLGYLNINGDGTASFEIKSDNAMLSRYEGSYELILAEDQKYPPGVLVLDLRLKESEGPQLGRHQSIKGSFFCEMGVQDLFMQLLPNDGDSLNVGAENPQMEYWFQTDIGFDYGDDDWGSDVGTDILGTWTSFYAETYDGEDVTLYLEFRKDGTMEYFYGYPESDIVERFQGDYYIVSWSATGIYPPQTVVFDLQLAGGLAMEDGIESYGFSGAYRMYSYDGYDSDMLMVTHIDGDPLLYRMQGTPFTFQRSMG